MPSGRQPIQQPCWQLPTWMPCDPCVDMADPGDMQQLLRAWSVASAFIWRQTGSRWPGACFRERVRPCVSVCRCWDLPRRYRDGYDWRNCAAGCWCGARNRLNLTDASLILPLAGLIGVNVYGGTDCSNETTEVWSPAGTTPKVRLEWEGPIPYLTMQDPTGAVPAAWPIQNLNRPDGGECTWSIDFRTGVDPPEDVLAMAWNLSFEIVKECIVTGCTLGQGATQVTTRGATFSRDPDQVGQGFWWSMLRETMGRRSERLSEKPQQQVWVEQFAAPPGRGVEWTYVEGPVPYPG